MPAKSTTLRRAARAAATDAPGAPLAAHEAVELVWLLRRAIAHNQLNLARHVPYADLGLVDNHEFEIPDTHSGTAYNSTEMLVDECEIIGDGDGPHHEVTVYIPAAGLDVITA